MDNPLELPLPSDPVQRIHRLAHDLAWGAIQGQWNSTISVLVVTARDEQWMSFGVGNPELVGDYLENTWQSGYPPADLLVSFGYFHVNEVKEGRTEYLLTEKAFKLLETPSAPPSVFISYKRDHVSTAFGLLIEARLKAAGVPNPFLDKNLTPGDDWRAQLEKIVRQSQFVICLVADGTLKSQYVLEELHWADDAGGIIIPVLHHDYQFQPDDPPVITRRQAIRVRGRSAAEYELALIELLNRLGYATT